MSEAGRAGDSIYLHAWDDYERFTVKVTGSASSGIGRTWLRAAGPEALARRVAVIEAPGLGRGWTDGEHGIGATYLFADPDGHEMGSTGTRVVPGPTAGRKPALKNQAEPFPGRGANVRRIDHVNYLARDIPEIGRFIPTCSARGYRADRRRRRVADGGLVPRQRQDLRPGLHGGLDRLVGAAAPRGVRDRPARGHPARGRRVPGERDPHRDRAAQARDPADASSCTSGSRAATASSCATPGPGWCWRRTGRRSPGRRRSGPRARPGG